MSSPNRDTRLPGGGKLLDSDDEVFDLTEYYKGLSSGKESLLMREDPWEEVLAVLKDIRFQLSLITGFKDKE